MDDLGFTVLVKMAADRISHTILDLREVIRLSKYGFAQSACGASPIRIVFDNKSNFALRHHYPVPQVFIIILSEYSLLVEKKVLEGMDLIA